MAGALKVSGLSVPQTMIATELGDGDDRQAALVKACQVAYHLARLTGRAELAMTAADRGYDAARRGERSDLGGLRAMNRSGGLMGLGARRRVPLVCTTALAEISAFPGRDDR